MTYLITFACYGQHLHGESGAIDPEHNKPGTPTLDLSPSRLRWEKGQLNQPPYNLDHPRRDIVLSALREVCEYRGWRLLAAHVRSTHVHVVVYADTNPERVMGDFKAYASRRLNQTNVDAANRKRWARHGSTRWLKYPKTVSAAIEYVVREQGEAMSLFESDVL